VKLAKVVECATIRILQSQDEHVGGSMLRCPDITKIENLGYECRVPLSDGLSKTINWYKDNLSKLINVQNQIY
jgi:nucleoside-diphosphate-sugar epimerase